VTNGVIQAAVTRCPGCQQTRRRGDYLCILCWDQLPQGVRKALTRRDGMAHRRAATMFDQIREGRPLAEIEVPA
jgi:hypothetical protein